MNTYWAAEDTQSVVSKISTFLSVFSLNSDAERSSLSMIWSRNLRMYYNSVISSDSSDSSLGFTGDDGELIEMHVPCARSDIRKIISIATRQRLHFKAQAESGEWQTKANTLIADSVASEYATDTEINLSGIRSKALEISLVCGHCFILTQWDAEKDKPTFRVIPPWMVTYNYNAESMANLDWFVVHYFVNRYTLAAEYPEYKDEILAGNSARTAINPWSINFGVMDYSEDDVLVSEFYHKGTPALENGRFIKFINQTGIEDTDNPYLNKDGRAEIPISMVAPELIQPYLIGYPILSDLLPLQEMTDHQFSVMATIFSALGVPTILNPRNSGINASNMSGLRVVSYSPQMGDGMRGTKPEVLELCKLPPNLLDTINLMQQFQQRISNVSGALQGILPPGVTAASAIATLSANSVEFIEPIANSVHAALEESMMRAITQTSQFLSEEKTIELVGPKSSSAVAKFSGDDLRGLKRVNLMTQNPLTMFAGGRVQIAEQYMKMGLLQSPEQFDTVMVYGSLDPIHRGSMSKENLIEWENQQMRQGQPVPALATDDHALHIKEHSQLLNDPDIRRKPELVQMIDDHNNWHLELSRTVDVGLYAMAQTGKNLPPDQNTPTGMPDLEQAAPSGQGGNIGELATEGLQGAEPAEPANPAFDLGEASGAA